MGGSLTTTRALRHHGSLKRPRHCLTFTSPRTFLWTSTMASAIVRQLPLELCTLLWFQSFWENR